MKNRFNLPQPFVRLIEEKTYDKAGADYSVTELLKPPRMVVLERRHQHSYHQELDVSDFIYSAMGTAMHAALEEVSSKENGVFVEPKLITEIKGKKIKGQPDRYEANGIIIDWKDTNVFSYKQHKAGNNKEWTQQLNCYAYMLRQMGKPVNTLRIWARRS